MVLFALVSMQKVREIIDKYGYAKTNNEKGLASCRTLFWKNVLPGTSV